MSSDIQERQRHMAHQENAARVYAERLAKITAGLHWSDVSALIVMAEHLAVLRAGQRS